MALIFQWSFLLTGPLWLLMLVVPRWHQTKRVMQSLWVVAPAALLYAILIISISSDILPLLLNPTLAGISPFLGSPAGATTAWIHLLAFDLFVGRWAYLDGYERGFSPWVMTPLLFLIVMVGPLGFLLYLVVRTVFGK